MLLIYHGRDLLPARCAAAIHTGWLPWDPPADQRALREAWLRLGGTELVQAVGLWSSGADAGGHTVCACVRASRPDIVHRAFHGMADIFGLEKGSFLLQSVGPAVAWTELKVKALSALGLSGWAERTQLAALRRQWREAQAAVAALRERVQAEEARDEDLLLLLRERPFLDHGLQHPPGASPPGPEAGHEGDRDTTVVRQNGEL